MARSDLLGIQIHRSRPPERRKDQYYLYRLADVNTFPTYFAPNIRYFMDESFFRAWEIRKSMTTTELVRTDVPNMVFEDCLVFLEVGLAQDIISQLFPADKRTLTPSCCKFVNLTLAVRRLTTYKGPDHFSLAGASVQAIFSFFGPYLSQAIDESKLREWEKETGQLETTDCVEVQLRDPTSRHGILKLRIGWGPGYQLVNSLYI